MESNNYIVDMSNIITNKNNNKKQSNDLNEQIICMENISKLVNDFNNNINNKQKLLDIVKQMRHYHGIIIKNFFDTLKSQGNFNHEEFYILSVTDSCYTTARNIVKQAEDFINGKITKLLDNVKLNNDNDNAEKDEDDDNDINYIKKNIKNEIDENIPTLVLFFESWCGACKAFKPIWNEIVRITDKKYINFVDTNDEKFMTKHKIQYIPTIILFNQNQNQKIIYDGARNIGQLADFINRQLNQVVCKPLAA